MHQTRTPILTFGHLGEAVHVRDTLPLVRQLAQVAGGNRIYKIRAASSRLAMVMLRV